MRRVFWIVVPTLALMGCAVGPDYIAPDLPTERAMLTSGATDAVDAAFWRNEGYDDLATLVEQALANNKDVDAALARVREAQAGLVAARGTRLPAIAADARYTAFEQSIRSPQSAGPLIAAGVIPRDGEFYTTSLQASWEIDLFGLRRRQIEASQARLLAQTEQARAVALQVTAQTVIAYADWQSFSMRAAVADRNVALQQETLDIISGKVRLGLSRRLDQVRAESALAQLQAQVPQLQAAAVAARQRLAVLLGTTADTLKLTSSESLLRAPSNIAIGTQSELLRRRPDVAIAERLLAAATADQGAAVAAMFPQLTLTASGGFEAPGISELSSGEARTTGIVPFVRWPLFQGRRLRAARDAADARQQQALAEYEQTVLQAIADTESAIAAQRAAHDALARVNAATDAAREAEQLANKLYQQGLVDYLTLLDAQRQLALLDDALLVSKNTVMLSAARLYSALGGSWMAP